MQALATKKASGKDLDAIEKLLDTFEGAAATASPIGRSHQVKGGTK
jgi:hypothetical protein